MRERAEAMHLSGEGRRSAGCGQLGDPIVCRTSQERRVCVAWLQMHHSSSVIFGAEEHSKKTQSQHRGINLVNQRGPSTRSQKGYTTLKSALKWNTQDSS